MTLQERFKAKIAPTTCWEWIASPYKGRYGQIKGTVGRKIEAAHRVAYKLFYGEIPEGLTIDHLCRNTRCVNPLHLEAVSDRENILRGYGSPAMNARKTHCSRGHEFTKENTRMSVDNKRICRICRRMYPLLAEDKK